MAPAPVYVPPRREDYVSEELYKKAVGQANLAYVAQLDDEEAESGMDEVVGQSTGLACNMCRTDGVECEQTAGTESAPCARCTRFSVVCSFSGEARGSKSIPPAKPLVLTSSQSSWSRPPSIPGPSEAVASQDTTEDDVAPPTPGMVAQRGMAAITMGLLGLATGFRDIAQADEERAREKYAFAKEIGKEIVHELAEFDKLMKSIGQ